MKALVAFVLLQLVGVAAAEPRAAKPVATLVGSWEIRTVQTRVKGQLGGTDTPAMPGTWHFDGHGTFTKVGGKDITGTYVLDGKKLSITTLGKSTDYEIVKLSPTELAVLRRFSPTAETTTTLDRK